MAESPELSLVIKAESNSPTVDSDSSESTLNVSDLLIVLDELVDWELVAVHLRGMTDVEIQKTKNEFIGLATDKQKLSIFSKWLSMCPDPSWDDVVIALEKGKEKMLAEKVRNGKVKKKRTMNAKQDYNVAFSKQEEEIVDELSKLHHAFTALLQDVQNEIERMVKKDKNNLHKLALNIQAAQYDGLKHLTKCETVQQMIEAFQANCSFLDGSVLNLIVTKGKIENQNLICRTTEHMKKAEEFINKEPIEILLDQINEQDPQTPLVLKLSKRYSKVKICLVKKLIQNLAGFDDIVVKFNKVKHGSVEITLSLISKDKIKYFKTITPEKKQFIRLIGMFYLQVGENPPIFQEDENMNYTFENGLLQAAKTGHIQAIEFILSIGIDVDYRNNEGKTALLLASEHGHSEAVKLILSAGASVDIQDNNGLTAVMVAKIVDIYQTLVQANANTNIVTHRGSTPLIISCLHGNHDVANYLLFTLKHNITTRPDGMTLLMAASEGGNNKIVEYLLDNGHDPNIQDNDGDTAIQLSCSNGHYIVTEILLKYNADPSIPDNNGWTPLMSASHMGHHKIVELLVQKGVDPNTPHKKNGGTALMLASEKGHNETVELLLSNGADPNIQDNYGKTAIRLSCFNSHYKATEILLKHNADPTLCDNYGYTPIMFAMQCGHQRIVELLMEHGVTDDTLILDAIEMELTLTPGNTKYPKKADSVMENVQLQSPQQHSQQHHRFKKTETLDSVIDNSKNQYLSLL